MLVLNALIAFGNKIVEGRKNKNSIGEIKLVMWEWEEEVSSDKNKCTCNHKKVILCITAS